ncbi:MAG: hypothetical protein AAFY71_24405 [Bacteroidota bacterium]
MSLIHNELPAFSGIYEEAGNNFDLTLDLELGSSSNQNQRNHFFTPLNQLLNPDLPLFLLVEEIAWSVSKQSFSPMYSTQGLPAHSMRLMVV